MGDSATFNRELGSAMYTPQQFWQQGGVFGGQVSPPSMPGLTVSGVTPPAPTDVNQSFFNRGGVGQPADPNVFRFMGPDGVPVDFSTQTYQALYGGLPGFASVGGTAGGTPTPGATTSINPWNTFDPRSGPGFNPGAPPPGPAPANSPGTTPAVVPPGSVNPQNTWNPPVVPGGAGGTAITPGVTPAGAPGPPVPPLSAAALQALVTGQ